MPRSRSLESNAISEVRLHKLELRHNKSNKNGVYEVEFII